MTRFGLDQLNPTERASLAIEIWESLAEDRPSSTWTDEQRRTIYRRDAELDANPEMAISWDDILTSVTRPT